MDALQLLAKQTRGQVDSLMRAVDALPPDKLDWQPAPGARSALDQLQEVATVFGGIAEAVRKRKLEMSEEDFGKWLAERKQITTREELETMLRTGTDKLIEFILTVDSNELEAKVEMPWPGDFRVADLLAYHYWNMAYHEGQITYIASMLA